MIKTSDNYILDRYVRIVLTTQCKNADLSKRGRYNFRCNVCGDSKKSLKKKRAWIFSPRRDFPSMFKCWNGDCDDPVMPTEVWLKRYFPVYYREYIKECLKSNSSINHSVTEAYVEEIRKEKDKISEERKDVENFIPILSGSGQLFDVAKKLCIDRKIPEKYWHSFFVCTAGKKYANRLIIPFYNNENKIYYFQGRSLGNAEPKYLNRTENKEDSIFNIYNVDKTKPIVVVEGPIDSMFIANSIAILGLDFRAETQEKLHNLDCYFIMDNDIPGRSFSRKLLKEGRKVFLWTKFINDYPQARECKDINDLVLVTGKSEFDFSYFSNPKWWGNVIYDEIYL